jgi:anti-anti-sigma regulatory factor
MKSSRNKKTAATRHARPAAKASKPASKASRSERKIAAPRASRRKTPAAEVATVDAMMEAAPVEVVEIMAEQSPPVRDAAAAVSPAASEHVSTPAAPQRAGLKLESSFTLRDATDMLFQLLAVDFGDSEVLIDGGGVERIDTAGLQMLIAFAKAHAARGKTIHWTAVSPELLRSSQLLGVAEPLHLGAHLNEGASGGH